MKEHDVFVLKEDLNSALPKGSQGTILMKFPHNEFLVEFGLEDGSNIEYEGVSTFTISGDIIEVTFIDPNPSTELTETKPWWKIW